MFDAIFTGLAWTLSFFYSLIPNYAIAIALLTLAVMVLLFPVNAKAVRSQAAMSKLQPEMKRIQQKYKDDPQELNAQTMALLKEHGTSPIGCLLPLLIQMPTLFIMYQVLRGLVHKDASGFFDPLYLDKASKLYQDLHQSKTMVAFGVNLAETASDALKVSYTTAIPFLILIAGVVATGYYQQRMITRRNPQQANDDNPMAKQAQTLMKVTPLMYLVFGFTLPAGLNVYFLTSSVFRIGQQALIYKMHPELLPDSGASTTVASRDVTPTSKASTNGSKDRSKDKAGHAKPITTGRVTPKKSKKRR
jgi:YidC/Oxa1 family membrane protein insertase